MAKWLLLVCVCAVGCSENKADLIKELEYEEREYDSYVDRVQKAKSDAYAKIDKEMHANGKDFSNPKDFDEFKSRMEAVPNPYLAEGIDREKRINTLRQKIESMK